MRLHGVTFLLLIILAFSSCKKEPIQFTFEGYVSESDNGTALSDVEVEVSQRVYNGSVASAFFNTAGTDVTGSDGLYSTTFDREKVFEFKVEMIKPGYFIHEEIIGSADVSTEEAEVVNAVMDPKSWITFHLVNIGGAPEDVFTMVNYNFRTGCEGCTANTYFYYEGVVDSTFTVITTGGLYANYGYKTPGSAVYTKDSVYMTPFDTVSVNINY